MLIPSNQCSENIATGYLAVNNHLINTVSYSTTHTYINIIFHMIRNGMHINITYGMNWHTHKSPLWNEVACIQIFQMVQNGEQLNFFIARKKDFHEFAFRFLKDTWSNKKMSIICFELLDNITKWTQLWYLS